MRPSFGANIAFSGTVIPVVVGPLIGIDEGLAKEVPSDGLDKTMAKAVRRLDDRQTVTVRLAEIP